jgi:hypothetical protein
MAVNSWYDDILAQYSAFKRSRRDITIAGLEEEVLNYRKLKLSSLYVHLIWDVARIVGLLMWLWYYFL